MTNLGVSVGSPQENKVITHLLEYEAAEKASYNITHRHVNLSCVTCPCVILATVLSQASGDKVHPCLCTKETHGKSLA